MAEDRAALRFQKLQGASKRGIIIRSSTMSLQDMILNRTDDFPSLSNLDSFNHSNTFHDVEKITNYNKMYKIEAPFRLVPASPGDRSCHWRPDALCVYRGAIVAGVRFPFHEFVPRLLADVGINPCQLPPNSWRVINCFMVLCLKNDFPLSVALFRKIFQFKNSAESSPGWVYVSHRTSTPPIFHPKSIPDAHPKWKREFMYVLWEGGDWGTIFRSTFGKVVDGSASDLELNEEETHAYNELIKDNYATMSWDLLNEFQLKSLGLSRVGDKAAAFINKTNEPEEGETARMKRARSGKDPRAPTATDAYLRPHGANIEEADGSSKSSAWRPNWGIRKKDSIVGDSRHAMDWSYHSITPGDFTDFVSGSTLEGAESAGAQAFAAANANFQGALFQAKTWRSAYETQKTKYDKSQEELASVRATLERREKELLESQAENVTLRKGKDDLIDEYLASQEYVGFMEKHDDSLFPFQFTQGWDGALAEVTRRLPGTLNVSDFPSPHAPMALAVQDTQEEDQDDDERILEPEPSIHLSGDEEDERTGDA